MGMWVIGPRPNVYKSFCLTLRRDLGPGLLTEPPVQLNCWRSPLVTHGHQFSPGSI